MVTIKQPTPSSPELIIKLLEKVKEKIRQGWCKYYYAKDSYGLETSIYSPNACRWCLVGAIQFVAVEDGCVSRMTQMIQVLADAAKKISYTGDSLIRYNDEKCQSAGEVVHLIDQAIQIQRERIVGHG